MGTQGTGRKRNSNKERTTAEDDALNLIARDAEARLAAKRAARAEAREIRMRELERQQKEIFQVQKKYYGLDPKSDDRSDSKWGDIEQWMEDSERYSRPSQTHTLSDDDERMSVGSRGSVRGSSLLSHKSKKKKKHKHKDKDRNSHDDEYSVLSSRASYASSDLYSLNGLSTGRNPGSTGSFQQTQSNLYEDNLCSGSRRVSGSNSGSHPLEYISYRSSNSRTSSRANSARTSPVDNGSSVASLLRSTSSSRGLPRDLDDVTIPNFSDVDDRDYLEKGSRAASALTATTLTSLGGTSSRRGSVETAITADAETATREIKEIHELKDQIQDVECKYTQNLKEVKEALTEVEEKYRKAMVSNAQLDNEKNNLMYQVDTLKDSLIELEELLSESRREYEEKLKDFEREKHAHSVLQFQFNEMKETLNQSEDLLNEIRQLRMKQESFAREITDLQETLEWKDKKIGALERQKEYTDAIRTERDELREEAVKLKDILKKHGIILGPDLSINGDASESETDVATSGDAAPQPAQGSLTSPSEGNNMLGSSEETQLRSREKETVDQEQRGEVFEEGQMSHRSADRLSNTDEASRPVKENDSGLSQGLQIALPVTNARDEIVLSAIVQENATSPAETVPQVNSDLEESDTQTNGNIEENSNDIIKMQPNKPETNEEGNLMKTEPSVEADKDSSPQEDIKDHETSCQLDVCKSESGHQEEIKDSESLPHQEVSNDSEPCLQVDAINFESCPQEHIQHSESCQDHKYCEPCLDVRVKEPISCLQVDAKDFESPELCHQVDGKKSESCPQEDTLDSKSHPEVDVKEFESCSQEKDLKDPEFSLQVDVKESELLPQDSIQGLASFSQVDVKVSESCPQKDINDSELYPQEDIKDFESCPQEDINDSELCPQEHIKDSESCSESGLQVDVEDSESHAQKENTKEPESCLQVDVKDFDSQHQEEDIKDPELCLQLDSKDSEPCPQEHIQDSKSYQVESCPQVDVKDFELCPQESIRDSDLCPQVDVKDFELHPQKEHIKVPESCPQVDVKKFELCPQVEDIRDSDSCPQEDINDSESCSQVLLAEDSEPCLPVVDPESNNELQHETAEASSDEADKNVTKPARKSANARGKKKKKKRRGKRKGGSLEEQNHQRDKKEENVTDHESIQMEGIGADLVNNESPADCGTDGHTIECLKESTVHQVDAAVQVDPAETSNVQNPNEFKMEQAVITDEQNTQHMEAGKVQILQPEAPIETLSLTLPLVQTKADHDTNKQNEGLGSVEAQEGCVMCSEPEVEVGHSGADVSFDSESCDKESVLDGTTTVDMSSQGDTSSLGPFHNEGETSSETTNYNKEDSVAKLEVQSHGETAHLELYESQNQMSVMSTYDIGDDLQDSELAPSEPSVAVNPDTFEVFEKLVFEQETFTNQEAKKPETECEYRFRKENEQVLENEQLSNLVHLENSSCDLEKGEILLETRAEPIADTQTLLCEDRVGVAASDTEVQTPESENVRYEVSNDKLASAEEPEQHESSKDDMEITALAKLEVESHGETAHLKPSESPNQVSVMSTYDIDDEPEQHKISKGDLEVTVLDTYQHDSEEDVDDEDEKGQSFDFDDMDLDAAMAMQTVENLEQKEVEVGIAEVLSHELNTDNDSNVEEQTDREAYTHVVTPENPGQMHIEMGVEVLPDECSNNNNSNVEKPTDREACAHVATADKEYEQNILVDVESTPEHLETVDNLNEQSHMKEDREASITGVPETTDKDQIATQATPLPMEALGAVAKTQDVKAALNNQETPLSGKDGKKNGKKGKSKGKDDCKIRLRKLVDEREKMIEQIKKLKAQVDRKSPKNGTDGSLSAEGELLENGDDPNIELQRDSIRQISDMKFKLVKAQQDVTALEQNVSRLDGQVSRYKSAAENAEKVEDELKAEKRKLQRELRSALDKVDELESNNSHLNKRLEKMKSSRGMAQTP